MRDFSFDNKEICDRDDIRNNLTKEEPINWKIYNLGDILYFTADP
jgi:hypothetical protein